MKKCELCEREVTVITQHHLIPRTLHTNKWFKKRFTREEMNQTIATCKPCHRHIHTCETNKELGRHFNSLDALLQHEEVKKFISWVKKR